MHAQLAFLIQNIMNIILLYNSIVCFLRWFALFK